MTPSALTSQNVGWRLHHHWKEAAAMPLDVIVTMPEWFRLANCAGTDPEAFHPEQGGNPDPAKNICGRCPIRDLCAEYALERPDLHGVWGGLTDRERSTMRAARQRTVQRQADVDDEPAPEDTPTEPVYGGVHGRYGPAGAAWHRRHGQAPCGLCMDAETRYNLDKRAGKRAQGLPDHPGRAADPSVRERDNERRRITRNGGPGSGQRYLAMKRAEREAASAS